MAHFWVISLLFWAVVKAGSFTWELPESHTGAIRHRDVFSKQSKQGEGMKLAAQRVSLELQKVKTKPAHKRALKESWKLGTDHSEMKIVTNCSQRRMVTHPLPPWLLKAWPALQLLLTVNSPGRLAGKMPPCSSVTGKYLKQ